MISLASLEHYLDRTPGITLSQRRYLESLYQKVAASPLAGQTPNPIALGQLDRQNLGKHREVIIATAAEIYRRSEEFLQAEQDIQAQTLALASVPDPIARSKQLYDGKLKSQQLYALSRLYEDAYSDGVDVVSDGILKTYRVNSLVSSVWDSYVAKQVAKKFFNRDELTEKQIREILAPANVNKLAPTLAQQVFELMHVDYEPNHDTVHIVAGQHGLEPDEMIFVMKAAFVDGAEAKLEELLEDELQERFISARDAHVTKLAEAK